MSPLHPTLAMPLIAYLEGDPTALVLNDWLEQHTEAEYRVPKDLAIRMRRVARILPKEVADQLAEIRDPTPIEERTQAEKPGLHKTLKAERESLGNLWESINDVFGDDGTSKEWQDKIYEQTNWLKTEIARLGGLEEA